MAHILILDSIYENHFSDPEIEQSLLRGNDVTLKHVASTAELAELQLETVDILLLWACVPSIAVDRSILSRLTRCTAIIKVAVGFENIDLAEARERGIDVFNVPDYGTEEVADHTLALLLSMSRKIVQMDRITRRSDWNWANIKPVHRIRDKILGVIGFGRIGGAVALRAQAFGMQVCFYDPYVPSGVEKTFGVRRHDDLKDLLANVDYLSIHCSLNDSSHHLIGRDQFAQMKRGVLLVNTARGGVIDSVALLDALDNNIVRMAGLDVVEGEPDINGRLRQLDSVILTAHSGFYSQESFIEMRETSAMMARSVLNQTRPRNLLN